MLIKLKYLTHRNFVFPFFLLSFSMLASAQKGILSQQLKSERVKSAYAANHVKLEHLLQNNGLADNKLQIALIALKQEKIIEVYARKSKSEKYSLLITYPICASSGKPGPKRKEGDLQVPEGFYYINHFNPESNFHLSLGINYPNKNDRKKSTATNPGGSIYIHGNCVTIGCLPITDAKIEELYLLALYAADAGQKQIPVYIFPFRMNETNMVTYQNKYASNKQLLSFWANLRTGYQLFFERYTEVTAGCNSNGDYTF